MTTEVLVGIAAVCLAATAAGFRVLLRRRTTARDAWAGPGVDETTTVLAFIAPTSPEAVRQALEEQLALPHEVPPVVGAMHISESGDDLLRVALGNQLGTEWAGVAAFRPDGAGGTSGTYRVTHWTAHEGVVQSTRITARMRDVRECVTAAVASQGGTSQVRCRPATGRSLAVP